MNNKIFFLLLLSFLGISQIWGQTTTISPFTSTSGNFKDSNNANIIGYASQQNGASSPPAINSSQLRLYFGSGGDGCSITLTPVAGITITNVTFTTTTGGTVGYSYGSESGNATNSSGTYTISGINANTALKIQNANTTNTQLRITGMTITYSSPLYWDATAGNANGVGGSANWTAQNQARFSSAITGSAALVAASTTGSIIFAGTPGTATLGFNATVTSSTFDVDGYTIATSGSGTKTLAGTINLTTRNIQFAPISGADLTIPGVISGTTTATSTALTKTGAGTLTLSSAGNTFTGKTLINDGYIATTGESLFGASPSSFTANQITLNGGGISAITGNINFSSNRGITLDVNGGKFNPSSGRTITLTNVVTGTGTLIKEGTGTVTLAGSHTYTGNTTVTAGTLQLSAANRIANTSNMVLDGGTFRTGAAIGYAETVGTLDLKSNSTIALGTGSHILTFSNSSGITWDGSTLAITGWTGSEGNSGTAGKIFIGNNTSGLTSAQLAKITFNGFTNGTIILPTGEIVPGLNTAPYFEIESISGASFGSVCVNSTATVDGTFDLYGFNLTGSDVTVGPLSGYSFSIDGLTFTNSLTLTPIGGDLAETIRIRFTPTAAQSYNGSISIIGGGVTIASTIPITGTGIANSTPTVSIGITTGTNPECSGSSVTFTATPANTTGGTVIYQWKLNGDNTGTNSVNYTSATLANDDIVSCVITITGGTCMAATTATSNNITMTVNDSPTITTIKPTSGGPAGTLVSISGTGFTPGSSVKFGTVDATDVQVISLTEIQAVVPDGAVSNTIEVSTVLSCPSTSTYTIINQDASGCN